MAVMVAVALVVAKGVVDLEVERMEAVGTEVEAKVVEAPEVVE